MEEISSRFNINVTRDIYVYGEAHHDALLRKLLKGYFFLNPKPFSELGGYRDESFFVVAALDFGQVPKMQATAQAFAGIESPLAHRIIYAVSNSDLNREHLLFAQEIGARYVASGGSRNDDFKEYLKRVCLEIHQVGSLAQFEQELHEAMRAQDKAATLKVVDKLKAIPHASEEATRLMTVGYQAAGDLRRCENSLKALLRINPQNLWAANTLGKLFIRSGRAAEGIEVLAKLSQFHELNGERLLTLGNAYVQAGMTTEARDSFDKGDALALGTDRRFADGQVKVKLAERDFAGALKVLGDKNFSDDLISFLNLRAIMSIRSGRFDEGVEYYEHALRGAIDAKHVRAKLKFNMGLAFVRHGNLEKAQEHFFESLQIGGAKFQRAKGPLDVVKTVLKNQDKSKRTGKAAEELMDDTEWETLF